MCLKLSYRTKTTKVLHVVPSNANSGRRKLQNFGKPVASQPADRDVQHDTETIPSEPASEESQPLTETAASEPEPTGGEYALKTVPFPLIKPEHCFNLLVDGWTTVSLASDSDKAKTIRNAIQGLLAAGQKFFDRDYEYKSSFATNFDSEEGFQSIPGEKEFFTVRTTQPLPKELREASLLAWSEVGDYLNDMLKQIATTLNLNPEALTVFSEPCIKLSDQKTATMLRIFRYEGWEEKVVAEPHHDLGLLSFVAGSSPGLEVFSGGIQDFVPIEKTYANQSKAATILVGRLLRQLTNERYASGGHRVCAYGSPVTSSAEKPTKNYRYSVVFVLRAYDQVVIDVPSLTSNLTGPNNFLEHGTTAGAVTQNLLNSLYNINATMANREIQKERIRSTQENKTGYQTEYVHPEPHNPAFPVNIGDNHQVNRTVD